MGVAPDVDRLIGAQRRMSASRTSGSRASPTIPEVPQVGRYRRVELSFASNRSFAALF
jgi:hypothetical protein